MLEVGCGAGQATRSLAALGCAVTAVEPGVGMAALARQRLAPSATSRSRRRRSRSGTIGVDASMPWWPPQRGTGSIRRSAGRERTTCSAREAGWRCSATSSSAGRASRRCMPRPPICTSVSLPETRIGVILQPRTMCEAPTRAGAWSRIPAACSAPRSCVGTRRCSGSTGTALPISFARSRRTAGSIVMSVSLCSTPSPSASAPG
ncbi:class I SAM-dependent methyltransferase [Micromonospora sp. KC721]|uniref:class I SAM-dependent methyltransferase n=1 Tax=Micromonospora sp. KC721 TaxID=2530380 RepID=UPI00352D196C